MAVSSERNVSRRTGSARERSYEHTYIDGNVVRRVNAVPQERPDRRTRENEQRRKAAHVNTRRNREKALRMNVPYVAFLASVSVATVFACVNYLQLQSMGTTYRSTIAALESQLSELKLTNDNAYEDAISSVDMEEVKNIAVNELGMTYADEGQIITYSTQEDDYIRQYAEIPTE